MVRTLYKHAANIPALTIGVVIGAVLLSGVAVAAAPGLVTIADPSGTNKASVNGAGQLLAAESNPRNTVVIYASSPVVSSCNVQYTVPTGKALIIKSATLYTEQPSNATGPEMDLYFGGCSRWITTVNPDLTRYRHAEIQSWPLGIPVPSGETVDTFCYDTSYCAAIITGYLVPSTLVPPIQRAKTPTGPLGTTTRH
jgi:hypothetical protein